MDSSKEIERDLERFYRSYIDLFNSEDIAGFLDCFAKPYVSIGGERGVNVVANDGSHASDFSRIKEALQRRGWARSDIVRITAWALDRALGMIVSDVTRRKSDGSTLEEVRACYLVCRQGQSWKIATISEVKPPFLGPGNLPR